MVSLILFILVCVFVGIISITCRGVPLFSPEEKLRQLPHPANDYEDPASKLTAQEEVERRYRQGLGA